MLATRPTGLALSVSFFAGREVSEPDVALCDMTSSSFDVLQVERECSLSLVNTMYELLRIDSKDLEKQLTNA